MKRTLSLLNEHRARPWASYAGRKDTMNIMLTTLGTQAEFHQTWQALMRQLETLLSIAHMRHPNRTETLEAISIAKHLLGKVGDQLDKAVQE